MFAGKRWRLMLLGTVVFPIVVPAVSAREPIQDDARMFSAEAQERARNEIDRVRARFNVEIMLETFSSMPSELKNQTRGTKEDRQLMAEWAVNRARSIVIDADKGKITAADGVYVLILRDPLYVHVVAGSAALERGFTAGRAERLERQTRRTLAKGRNDVALENAVLYIGNDFQAREFGERWLWLVGVVGVGIGFWLVLVFIRSRMKRPFEPTPEILPSYAERAPANADWHVKPAEPPWSPHQ
jgi:hypothetical protein